MAERHGGALQARLGDIDVRALVGSGCLWAWFDAGFMGAFSVGPGLGAFWNEAVSQAGSFAQLLACALLLVRSRRFASLVEDECFIVASGALGTLASLGIVAANLFACLPAALAAQVASSVFVGLSVASWGGLYCRDGSRSALVYVTGGFALALVCDLLFLLMVSPVPAFAFSLLPVLSSWLLSRVARERRAYPPQRASAPAAHGCASSAPRAGRVFRYLGVSPTTVFGIALMMVGFGYMQCQISLEAASGGALIDGPVAVHLVRGVVSVFLFAFTLVAPRRMSAASRVGLLVFIAGFSAMPFVYATDLLWVPGMAVIVGYTVIDVLVWVVTAQAAVISSTDALRTVCIMRLLVNCVCQAFGRVLGFVVFAALPAGLMGPVVSLFGYLMTAGVVLLLSGRDIWDLFRADPPARPAAAGHADVVERLARDAGLTQREREVFGHLAQGRSKPWVARELGISDSTVNTHVRSLYEKLGVTNRQDLLDLVVCGQSTEADEEVRPLG